MQNQKEVWLPVKDYEGLYEISSIGRVKSLERISNNRHGSKSIYKEKILSPGKRGRGYLFVSLSKNCTSKNFSVHQLVAISFLGHNMCGMHKVVDHINDNKIDNRVDNLQIISNRQNVSKSLKNKTSDYNGVCWDESRGKWKSQITINGKNKYLGRFKIEIDASNAYQEALKEFNTKAKEIHKNNL